MADLPPTSPAAGHPTSATARPGRPTASRPGPRSALTSALAGALGLATAGAAMLATVGVSGCAPLVRPPSFEGARDRVSDASLLGPFDGQVVDEATSEPVAGATVVGVWSYDEGDGLVTPAGSETIEVKTDQAGRYRLPDAPQRKRGSNMRLVSFQLVVYKRGYVGYRSDRHFDGTPRTDFTVRHNRASVRKWRDTDSHAQHLMFLASPASVRKLSNWEREAANLDLYRAAGGQSRGGDGPAAKPDEPSARMTMLDAAALLPPEDIRRRTGYSEAFERKELGDLARTHFYHGVHLEAVGREEAWDVAYRVWKDPPGGLDPVVETFEATLPDVEITGEITADTWVFDSEDVRAVAFLDRERNVGVLLTCGAMQCIDIETVIILAGFLHDNLDALAQVDAETGEAIPATEPTP